ncbi:ABC transporter substrate-binding protein [Robbsia sp. Bb-Pol-6]|uniref:ABC transporter substrate-binding protein n=1 Tax=Robbsia betulipollinis TaxID=2981849 RepID=A0ABT3ZPH9_9BURK|nr:ABC transporter substrate-binding protein [Robbsia betulipollinis]MCY0387843.1 ABC transporter substrate-binding protein [Robbsia betulipollinis]
MLATGSIAAPVSAAAIDESAPDVMIGTLAADILQTVRADPQVKAGDMARITQLVNEKLLPHTDFRRTTRLALGRFWNQATPAQQDQLVKQFEMLLIHTYAGATAKVGDQTVRVKPLRATPDQSDVVVHTEVMSQGRAYPVDYRLEKTPEGWKIYDVNVLGAWLIQAYRQQFAAQVQQSGVAGLLTFLTQRNEQLAAAQQSAR